MSIGGSFQIGGAQGYYVSSIHGNPTSLRPIRKLSEGELQRNKALVIAQKTSGAEYVKDYGELEKTTSVSTDGLDEVLALQKEKGTEKSYTSYIMDTIGVMGFKNQLREQLGLL